MKKKIKPAARSFARLLKDIRELFGPVEFRSLLLLFPDLPFRTVERWLTGDAAPAIWVQRMIASRLSDRVELRPFTVKFFDTLPKAKRRRDR